MKMCVWAGWICLGLAGWVGATDEPVGKKEPPVMAGATAGMTALPARAAAQPKADMPPVMGPQVRELVERARKLQSEEKWAEAIAQYEKARQIEPGNEYVLFGLGTTYSQVGKYKEALSMLEELRKKAPGDASVMNNLAWIYAKTKDPEVRNADKALHYGRRAAILSPSDPNIWNTLAEAYYAAGEYQRAFRVARLAYQMAALGGEANLKDNKELLERCRSAAGVSRKGLEDQE